MTDNRTTELLREGLTKRGIEWKNVGGTTSGDGITEWIVDGMTCRAAQRVTVGIEHLALYIPVLTPEQAIAATLGSATLTAEQVREAIEHNFGKVAVIDDGSEKVEWREGWVCNVGFNSQAIADELNAELRKAVER